MCSSTEHDSHWAGRCLGFTLIELLVVLAIVALLLSIAVPRYFQHIEVAKETVLKENLRIARDAIDKFYSDSGHYPESLDDLIAGKYLRAFPFDPVAGSNKDWIIVGPDGGVTGKVFDLRSAAPGADREGVPFGDL